MRPRLLTRLRRPTRPRLLITGYRHPSFRSSELVRLTRPWLSFIKTRRLRINRRVRSPLSRRDVSDLSRRDNRTQPGVSTPGMPPTRPTLKGGRKSVIEGSLDQRPFLRQSFCRPFRAVRRSYPYLGLKPQAESYYPFGISPDTSLQDGSRFSETPGISCLATFVSSLRDTQNGP